MKNAVSLERVQELKQLGYEVRFICDCPWRVYLNGTYVGDGLTRKEDSAWHAADKHARKAAKDTRA